MRPNVPLAALLDRLAEEASALAAAAARAEAGLQLVLDRVADLPAGAATDVQRLDLVRQSLEDFARLLWVAAAAAVPPQDDGVAASGLDEAATLSGLRTRLCARPGEAHPPASGELDDLQIF